MIQEQAGQTVEITKGQDITKSDRIEYSPENPPPLDILRAKIYAVHVTNSFPTNGRIVAAARDNTSDHIWGDQEPPSFRPTIHASLGEVFTSGSEGGFSREEMRYAIIYPLPSIESQLISVFSNDTIILGNMELSPESIVIAPEGSVTETEGIRSISYNPDTATLRDTVNAYIKQQNGWNIHTDTFIDGPHSFASKVTLENQQIGDMKFFQSLLDAHPQVGYGTHFQSERGDAWRMGSIDYKIYDLIKRYTDSMQNQVSTPELKLWTNLISHNISSLKSTITADLFPEHAVSTYHEKEARLMEWVNLLQCDLYARDRYGKTITAPSKTVWKELKKNKADLLALQQIVDTFASELNENLSISSVDVEEVTGVISNMPPQEFDEFISANKSLFDREQLEELKLSYVVKRWLIIKTENANNEGLETILHTIKPKEGFGRLVFNQVRAYLNQDCTRLNDVFSIMRNSDIASYLLQDFGINFSAGEPRNIADVVRLYPDTKSVFDPINLNLSEENQEIYKILLQMDQLPSVQQLQASVEQITSFDQATNLAYERKTAIELVNEAIDEVKKPMSKTRDLDKIGWGRLCYYELLKKNNPSMKTQWEKVGYEEEYNELFPSDNLFWHSNLSFLEIYQLLKSKKITKVIKSL